MPGMLQLNPPIPVVTLKGKGLAQVIIDYGPEHDLMWVVFQDITGECWSWRSADIRANDSFPFERMKPVFKPDPLDEV